MRIPTRIWLGGMSFGGVVVAHALGYVVAAPDPHERASLLAETGHGYWPWLLAVALGTCVAGFASFVVGRARGSTERPSVVAIALRLAALQIPLFVALEATERLISGHPDIDLLLHPAVGIGVAAQALVAVFGALLIATLARAVDAFLFRRRGRHVRRSVGTWPIRRPQPARDLFAYASFTRRGPPRHVKT